MSGDVGMMPGIFCELKFFSRKFFGKLFGNFFRDHIENFARLNAQNAFRVLRYAFTGIVGEVGDRTLAQAVASKDGLTIPGVARMVESQWKIFLNH